MKRDSKLRRVVTAAMGGVVVSILFIVLLTGQRAVPSATDTTHPSATEEDIPLPFDFSASHLKGQLISVGKKGAINLRQISFDAGETSEVMQGPNHVDTVDFVLTPDDNTISNVQLCRALTAGKRVFGYKYTSRAATAEKDARDLAATGAPLEFTELFPGEFFVSQQERAAGPFIGAYESQKNMTFKDLCAVTLSKNARYVIVVNDVSTTFTARLMECGDTVVTGTEECDDGAQLSGDGCSGTDAPNGACMVEFCGDGYVDTDGIPDAQQPDGHLFEEQCDDGSICVGGSKDGMACTSFGGALNDIQCPGGGVCTVQSFDGCATNCLAEVCGNASWELLGLDGKPGKRGQDDDGNGTVDDMSERWAAGSDDEDCDMGGSCTLNGQAFANHDCLTPGAADICRQDGGTCVPRTANGCFNTCKRDIWNFLHIANANTDSEGAAVPTGVKKVGVFRLTADAAPDGYLGYEIRLADFLFTVDATNVAVNTSGLRAVLPSTSVTCEAIDQNGTVITTSTATGKFYARCRFNESSLPVLILGTNAELSLEMNVANPKVNASSAASLRVVLEKLATAETQFGLGKSGIRWIAGNGPQVWPQFRVKDDTDSVASTFYGELPYVCGNGIREATEQCDDGNQSNTDTCTNACENARCGDTFKQGTEQCDDGNTDETDACRSSCVAAACGDGIQQVKGADGQTGTADDEQCDDGNTIDDDACDNTCRLLSPF